MIDEEYVQNINEKINHLYNKKVEQYKKEILALSKLKTYFASMQNHSFICGFEISVYSHPFTGSPYMRVNTGKHNQSLSIEISAKSVDEPHVYFVEMSCLVSVFGKIADNQCYTYEELLDLFPNLISEEYAQLHFMNYVEKERTEGLKRNN